MQKKSYNPVLNLKRIACWIYSEKILIAIRPPYEKLVGDLTGAYSRRINIQHRLIYQILEDINTVKIIRMWTHYD